MFLFFDFSYISSHSLFVSKYPSLMDSLCLLHDPVDLSDSVPCHAPCTLLRAYQPLLSVNHELLAGRQALCLTSL